MFFLILGILFPLASSLTHIVTLNNFNIADFIDSIDITGHFTDIHYDAWSQIGSVIKYCDYFGYTYGFSLSGVFLFFIPRTVWPLKPEATGQILGDFLSSNHDMWFNNLSAPIVAEGYLNFGFLGIFFISVLFAFFMLFADKLIKSSNELNKILGLYFTLNIFFILRGSLLPAFAYTMGFFFCWLFFYFLYNYLYKINKY
jgi:hypothetical protein